MAAGTPLSAKNAKVRVGTSVLYAAKWEVTPETNPLDSSNFEGGGFEDQIAGLRKLTIHISGWWDGGANMHDAPLNIQDGQVLTNVKAYVNDTTGPYWNIPSGLILGVPVQADVHEKVMYDFTLKAKGTFSYPTGNAA